MNVSIIFNRKSAAWEIDNPDFNRVFVKAQMEYVKELYRARGYIYLEQIYTCLRIKWNPYNENVCSIRERDGEFGFNIGYNADYDRIVIDMFTLKRSKLRT